MSDLLYHKEFSSECVLRQEKSGECRGAAKILDKANFKHAFDADLTT